MVVSIDAFRTRLLTVRTAAKILNVHENTLRRWCDKGILTCYRIGPTAQRRIPEDDIVGLNEHMHENHGRVLGIQWFLLTAWLLHSFVS